MKRWTIYCHTHIESGRRYVGLTSQTMLKRWNQHVSKSKSSKGGRWHFPNAIRKYGPEAFEHEVLEVCETLKEANAAEIRWVEHFNTRNPLFGFNLAEGGGSQPHPIRKNPWDDRAYRARQLARSLDYLHSPEARSKMKATVSAPEFKAKQSALSREIHSRPEVKAKLSAASKGHIKTAATRAKISANMTGHVTSQETRAKIGAKGIGRKHSAESKAKMSRTFSASPAAERTRERLRKFTMQDGEMIKYCAVHGAVTDVYIKMRKNEPQVRCAACERAKARARNKTKSGARADCS